MLTLKEATKSYDGENKLARLQQNLFERIKHKEAKSLIEYEDNPYVTIAKICEYFAQPPPPTK